ncbi:MAG: hypothetical protein KME10_07025 [Plectolyngbya sp. WJT66-NPBG17]|jgi:multicomponent Na+:H+ antiporter subunit B|nr:hypothetical protein [Plectolyngbya sp. WJT66-NPBG17]
MKWVYIAAGIVFYLKMVLLSDPALELSFSIVDAVLKDSGVPNVVSGIILRNRLYDTIFEVIVFTIAIIGASYLLANERPLNKVHQFTDETSILLARLGATISALVGIELAIRGHLSPGGGFAAGVAGGTAIGLVAIKVALGSWAVILVFIRYRGLL